MRFNIILIFILIYYLSGSTLLLNAQYVWRHKACLPAPGRWNQSSFAVGGKFYSVGGYVLGTGSVADVWEYDPASNTWTQKNDFPSARSGTFAFVINDTAYVCLGGDPSANYQSDCWRYEQSSDAWTQMASFPGGGRYTPMGFVLNNKAYVGCGKNGNGEYNDFYEYDPVANSWTQMANFPGTPRQSGFGVSIDTFGYMGLGGSTVEYNDSYRYDASSNSWTAIANFPIGPPNGPGFFVLNDTLYISSGDDFLVMTYNYCYAYDPVSNTWSQKPDYSCIAPGRFNAAGGFSYNGRGYVQFGCNYNSTSSYNDFLEFGPLDTGFMTQQHIFGNDTTYCGSFSRVLSTNDSCTQWSTGDVGYEITVTSAGTYWAYYDNGCGISIDTIHIYQSAAIAVNLGNDTSLCNSQTIQLNAANVGSNYAWSNGLHTQIIYASSPGTYSVTVTNSSGCQASASVIISYDSIQLSTNNIQASCGYSNGQANVMVYSGYTPFKYLWSNNDTTPTISNLGPGIYSITVTDASGCTSSTSVNIISIGNPSVTISTPQTTICPGDTVQICASQGFISYAWSNGDTSMCIQTTYAGNYSVTASEGISCSATSNEVTISVHAPQPVTVSITGDTLTCYPSLSYQWYLNGNLLPGDTNNILIANQPGSYEVKVLDGNGCYDFSGAVQVITGISTLRETGLIMLYPDPATTAITIKLPNEPGQDLNYKILAADGKVIKCGIIAAVDFSVPVEDLTAGMYIFQLIHDNHNLCNKRFAVLR